ncbi:hypothetical protein V6N11_003466 [Hibiscus sabdariffa]|uniref:Uncharacterized protein n=1 Tax=Hibiscus sabdariffa TaxID=183260 RepID=A0ABR2SDY9_9ROSI
MRKAGELKTRQEAPKRWRTWYIGPLLLIFSGRGLDPYLITSYVQTSKVCACQLPVCDISIQILAAIISMVMEASRGHTQLKLSERAPNAKLIDINCLRY